MLSTYTHRLAAGEPKQFSFYAAGLPAALTTATVDLGQLGTAEKVTVTRP